MASNLLLRRGCTHLASWCPISEDSRHEASVPGDPETRLVTSGWRHLLCLTSSQALLLLFEVCASKTWPLGRKELGQGSAAAASLSLPQESPSSPSIAKMNGGCATSFIKYE